MKFTKQETRIIEDLILLLIGFIIFGCTFIIDSYLGIFLFILGLSFPIIGAVDILLAFNNKPFPTFKRFRKNNKGVVWIWAMAISTLIMAAIVFFIATYPLDLIIQLITEDNGFHFSGVMGACFDLCRQIVMWLLGFCVFGVILWMLVNANRRGGNYPGIG